jgi:hypothetical protein
MVMPKRSWDCLDMNTARAADILSVHRKEHCREHISHNDRQPIRRDGRIRAHHGGSSLLRISMSMTVSYLPQINMKVQELLTPERRAEINQRKVLLEKRKKASTSTLPIEDMVERDLVNKANRDALSAVMQEFNLYIKASDFPNWRPTIRNEGDIPGVAEAVTIVATNGLLAYFIQPEGDALIGHIQKFSGDVVTLYSTRKEKAAREKKPRKSLIERALEALTKG